MSDRSLRKNTRVNYAEMDEVSNDGSGEESENNFEDVDDREMAEMEERLEALKIREQKMERANKFRRMSAETRKIENSLKKLNKPKKKMNVNDLREMRDVIEEADEQLEKSFGENRRKTKKYRDSSEETSEDDTKIERKTKRKGKERKGREKKEIKGRSRKSTRRTRSSSTTSGSESEEESTSSEDEKPSRRKERKGKKSGKDQTLTCNVKFPQKWPHSHLAQQFVNQKKKFEELSIGEFCAGYTNILRSAKGSERKYRLEHLEELMYLSTQYHWRNVLNYHGAVLIEIERGNKFWGDAFQSLRDTTLAGGFLTQQRSLRFGSSSFGKDKPSGGRVLFCSNYQKGTCNHSKDHHGNFLGEKQLLRHICAKCWLTSKNMSEHPEMSDKCPLFDQES